MPRLPRVVTRGYPPRWLLDKAANGDRHALASDGTPIPSARELLIIRPDGLTGWDTKALHGHTR